jgi:RNA polymerase sigma-70 factor (ECF subfamily)
VRDPSEAEDLLQETFLSAIERAQQWQRDRRLVPWLVGILVVAARRRARERSRVPDPGRLNFPTTSAPEASASAHEFRAEVERALAALPADERGLLAQYLLDERKPHEIAGEQGLAPGTVRMRIQRALESLRRLLPVGAALGGALLFTSPRSLAEVRSVVLEHARARAASVTASWLGTKALIALALGTCALLAGWFFFAGAPSTKSSPRPSALAAGPEPSRSSPGAQPLEAPPSGDARVPGEVPKAATESCWVRIAVEDPLRLEPARVRVFVAPKGLEPTLRAELPASNELLLDVSSLATRDAPRPNLVLRIDHPDYMAQSLSVDFPTEEVAPGRREVRASVRLERALSFVEGTIELEGLAPDPKGLLALVAWTDVGPRVRRVIDQAEGLRSGPFRLRSSRAGAHTLVASLAGAAPHSQQVELVLGEALDVGRIPLARGLAIRGTVKLPPSGAGWVADIRAELKLTHPADLDLQSLCWRGEQLARDTASARSASDGSFELGGLSEGIYRVRVTLGVSSPNGTRPFAIEDESSLGLGFNPTVEREIPSPSEDVSIVLPPEAASWFLLRVSSAGVPLAQASVEQLLQKGGMVGARCDQRGELPILLATEEPFRLRISKPGFQLQELELVPARIPAGSTRDVVLEAGPPVIAVVFDAGGVPLEGLSVQLVPLASLGEERPKPSDLASPRGDLPGYLWSSLRADGTLCDPVAAGVYWGRVLPRHPPDNAGNTNILPAVFECTLEPDKPNRVQVALTEGGRVRIDARALAKSDVPIRVSIRDPAGAEIWTTFWERTLTANGIPTGRGTPASVLAGAVMECSPLPAGEYSVVISPRDKPATEHKLLLEPGKSSTLVLSP